MKTVNEWDELFDDSPKYGIGNLDEFIKDVQDDAKPQWQPIETAPKDGSDVFAWGPRWKQPDYIHFRNGEWCEWVGPDTGEWEPITFSEPFLPTHWMPIPEPPKK